MQEHMGRTAHNLLSSQRLLVAKGHAACDHTGTDVNDRVQAGRGAGPSAVQVSGRCWLFLWVVGELSDNGLRRSKAEAGGQVRSQW